MAGNSALATSISVGVAPVILLPAKVNRVSFTLYNEAGTLYVLLGPGVVSKTYYTTVVKPDSELTRSDYTGTISGVKGTGTANVLTTEIW